MPKVEQQRVSPLPHVAHRRAQGQARSIAAPAYRTSSCPKSKRERAKRSGGVRFALPAIVTTPHPACLWVRLRLGGGGGVVVVADNKEIQQPCGYVNQASRNFSDLDAGTGDPEEVIAEGSGVALDATTRVLN